MQETVSTISSKGQITIPANVRRHLGIGGSDKVTIVITDEGRVELRPVRYSLASILGSLSARQAPRETDHPRRPRSLGHPP